MNKFEQGESSSGSSSQPFKQPQSVADHARLNIDPAWKGVTWDRPAQPYPNCGWLSPDYTDSDSDSEYFPDEESDGEDDMFGKPEPREQNNTNICDMEGLMTKLEALKVEFEKKLEDAIKEHTITSAKDCDQVEGAPLSTLTKS